MQAPPRAGTLSAHLTPLFLLAVLPGGWRAGGGSGVPPPPRLCLACAGCGRCPHPTHPPHAPPTAPPRMCGCREGAQACGGAPRGAWGGERSARGGAGRPDPASCPLLGRSPRLGQVADKGAWLALEHCPAACVRARGGWEVRTRWAAGLGEACGGDDGAAAAGGDEGGGVGPLQLPLLLLLLAPPPLQLPAWLAGLAASSKQQRAPSRSFQRTRTPHDRWPLYAGMHRGRRGGPKVWAVQRFPPSASGGEGSW